MKDLSEKIIAILKKEGTEVPLSWLIKEVKANGNMQVSHNGGVIGIASQEFWDAMHELKINNEITEKTDYDLKIHEQFKSPFLKDLTKWLPIVIKAN
jgi:hypothetical protein